MAMKIRLRDVRTRKFLTQDELAERTGLTKATISRLENGLQDARIPTVRRLAAALDVEPAELLAVDEPADAATGQAP